MKIKIRTITLQSYLSSASTDLFKKFKDRLSIFKTANIEPRTFRVVSDLVSCNKDEYKEKKKEILNFIKIAKDHDFWAALLCLDLSQDNNDHFFDLASNFIDAWEGSFVCFAPVSNKKINLKSIPKISNFILNKSSNPIDNFRIGTVSEPISSPFFPLSCSTIDKSFVVGLEMVGFLTQIVMVNNRSNLEKLREIMIQALIEEIIPIQKLCEQFEKETGIHFNGFDLSLAPYPYPLEDQSVVILIETIGQIGRSRGEDPFEFGSDGTHFINSFLTDILKFISKHSSIIKTTGFNGVMYSVLEDTYLSKRYEDNKFDINFLKLLSTTCGCGIDMVPLPGDTKNSTLSGMIIDVLSTAIVLGKPLGVRVLPIPNSKPGDKTQFRHLFFSNTKVRDIPEGITLQYLPDQNSNFNFKNG